MIHDISTFDKLEKVLRNLAAGFAARQIVLLIGPMGSGKTTAVSQLVKILGGDSAQSPTFAIHQVYKLSKAEVDHIDLYRLKNEADLESTGFWDLFSRRAGLILIEWGDRLDREALPRDWHISEWHFQNETCRTLQVR